MQIYMTPKIHANISICICMYDPINTGTYEHSGSLMAAQKRYYNKIKENPEFQEVRRGYSKKHYDNNKSTVIARVQRYQARVQDMEQIERLHELQQQGLINVQTGELTQEQYDKYNNRLLNRLAHLHLSS